MPQRGSKKTASLPPAVASVEFSNLPDDVVYLIFSKCDITSLGRLGQTCRRFNRLINSDCVWLQHSKTITIIRTAPPNRQTQKLPLKECCRISLNWASKYFRERTLCRYKKQMPWMNYCDKKLWVSTRNTINCYNVKPNGHIEENVNLRLTLHCDDVSRFVVKNNTVVSGCRDGSIYMFDSRSGQKLGQFIKVHNTDTQTVDFHENCIISGSRDQTVKIFSTIPEDNGNHICGNLVMNDRVWSVAISPHGKNFTVGTAGCFLSSSLSLWDMKTIQLMCSLGSYRHGAGVLDIKYETDSTLLTCGYDSFLRLWDTRIGQCVLEWEEPFDTTLYCLQSDRDVTMVTGSSRYGMLRLWDKRIPKSVQLFYLGEKDSPVYSLAFDSSHLYAALDSSVRMADFSILPP